MPSINELKAHYEELPDERLLQLRASGALTETALAAIDLIIKSRGLTSGASHSFQAVDQGWTVHPSPIAPLKMPLTQLLFSTKGRIPRSTWWLAMLVNSAVFIVVLLILQRIDDPTNAEGKRTLLHALEFSLVVCAAASQMALSAKRWQDLEWSAWYALIIIIPAIGGLITIIFCGFAKGTTGPNRYGPDPLSHPSLIK